MESLLRRVVWYFYEPRRYPRTTALLLTAAAAGSALALYYLLNRLRSGSPVVVSMPSGALLRHLIQQRAAILASKLSPLGGNAQTLVLRQGGVPFLVTVLDAKAEGAKKATGALRAAPATPVPRAQHPPPPPQDALERAAAEFFVADVPPAHTLFFNKFPVVPNALILATKAFEPQAAPLSLADMRALWAVVRGVRGLGFFNSGPESGASQPRRHMQLIPFAELFQGLPPDVRGELPEGSLPVDVALRASGLDAATASAAPGATFTLPAFAAFPHAFCALGPGIDGLDIDAAAAALHAWYLALLATVHTERARRRGLVEAAAGGGGGTGHLGHARPATAPTSDDLRRATAAAGPAAAPMPLPQHSALDARLPVGAAAPHLPAYDLEDEASSYFSHNMLLTPAWMAVVPRSRAEWGGFSVNSVGFAGLLLARTEQLPDLRGLTPLGLLAAVTTAPAAADL